MSRRLLSISGLLLALPFPALLGMAVFVPITLSGMGYLLGGLLVCAGLILLPWRLRSYILSIIGTALLITIAVTRVISTERNSNIHIISLPAGSSTSWLARLVDEQDALIYGESLFHWIGGDSNREHSGLTSAFVYVYSAMHAEGIFSSPVLGTYLNQQRPEHFDAVIIGPESDATFGLVFLHGYMGNVTAQCWVIAQAVKELGGVTLCPSTIWTGEWWQPDGQRIIQRSLEYLKTQGVETIYLGGFSNGGFSIGYLAGQLKGEPGISGLILIDGFLNGTDIRELGLPVLILEGIQDERVPVNYAREFVQEVGKAGTYVEIESDHFLIIKEPRLVQNTITTWLRSQLK